MRWWARDRRRPQQVPLLIASRTSLWQLLLHAKEYWIRVEPEIRPGHLSFGVRLRLQLISVGSANPDVLVPIQFLHDILERQIFPISLPLAGSEAAGNMSGWVRVDISIRSEERRVGEEGVSKF